MHFSIPCIIAFAGLCCRGVTAQVYDYEASHLDLLEARDNYLAAREEYLQVRDIFSDDGLNNYLDQRSVADFEDLQARGTCTRCNKADAGNYKQCAACRAYKNQNQRGHRAARGRGQAQNQGQGPLSDSEDEEAAQILASMKSSGPPGPPGGAGPAFGGGSRKGGRGGGSGGSSAQRV